MSETFQSKKARLLILLALAVPCLLISIPATIAYLAQRELTDCFHWVSHTREVETEIQHFALLADDAESSARGFLLTGRKKWLDPYQAATGELPHQLAKLRSLTADNLRQQEHIRQLGLLLAPKLEFMAQSISLQEKGEHDAAVALVNTERGKQTMEAIRAKLQLMEQEEARLLVIREERLTSQARRSTGVLWALVGVSVLFAAAILVLLRRLAKMQNLVTMCAWSRTVEYNGEWLSFEQYLLKRFDVNTSHGISPAEAEKVFAEPEGQPKVRR